MNKVELLGELADDPVARETRAGPVCNYRVVTRKTYEQGGHKREAKQYHRVTQWGSDGQGLRRGDWVRVQGELQTRKWEDREGQTRWVTEVVGNVTQEGTHDGQRVPHDDRPRYHPVTKPTDLSEQDIPF